MILFFPHYNSSGGAGKYIISLANEFRKKNIKIYFSGFYKKEYEYDILEQSSNLEWIFNRFIIPNYKGVSLFVKLFYLIRCILLIPLMLIYNVTSKLNLENVKVVVLTSMIQAPLLYFLRSFSPKISFVLLIQENAVFDGFFGRLFIYFYKFADVIVCIDSNSFREFVNYKLNPVLILNSFDDYNNLSSTSNYEILYDAIYVGGGNEIKGFSFLIESFKKMSKNNDINILMLGYYSKNDIRNIERINNQVNTKSRLHVIGVVDSCSEYYVKAKFLILPIVAPHFCRPAIEAGLLKKTFLIPLHEGLTDFAIANFNCKVYENRNIDSFIKEFMSLIQNKQLLNQLEENNYILSLDFKQKSKDNLSILLKRIFINNQE